MGHPAHVTPQQNGDLVPESVTTSKINQNGAQNGQNVHEAKNGNEDTKKPFVRDPIFAYFNKPLGLEQRIFNMAVMVMTHSCAALYMILLYTGHIKSRTWIFELFYGYIGGMGTTAGAHRYWSHKTYKATKPLQILLMIMQTIAAQYPIHKWVLDHRCHHKYTDTEGDPHSSKKGFWWSHWIWIYYPRSPELLQKMDAMYMTDLENDPVVRFQSKYYWPLIAIFHYAIPISFVYWYYQEPLFYCFLSANWRFVLAIHLTWTVNSVAHKWGDKPYDQNISPVENILVSFWTNGEGWHNYHHAFPWDYKAAEFGWKMNGTTIFIDFFAWLGWAYDLKMVSKEVMDARVKRTGKVENFNSNSNSNENDEYSKGNSDNCKTCLEEQTKCDNQEEIHKNNAKKIDAALMSAIENPSWGWDDKEMPEDLRNMTSILRPEKSG